MKKLFVASSFLAAFLLFTLELYFAKLVVPFYGGVPAVWNTCLVFFQVVLLLGYLYAHFLTTRLTTVKQVVVHGALLVASCFFLPVTVPAGGPPPGPPALSLLRLLIVELGVPFFALAATAPLIQRWFSYRGRTDARDPYFLYAAGNAGSFAALAGYLFGIEPLLPLAEQSRAWGLLYAIAAALIVGCAVSVGRASSMPPVRGVKPAFRDKIRWAMLAAVPSAWMMGLTSFIASDVASVPLVWAAVLAVYLATFVSAFSGKGKAPMPQAVRAFPLLVVFTAVLFLTKSKQPLWAVLAVHFAALYVAGLVFHGELFRRRPAAVGLTSFYVWLSFGGVCGGLFHALAAPVLFKIPVEYPLTVAVAAALAAKWFGGRAMRAAAVLAPAALAGLFFHPGEKILWRSRNFFGALRVVEASDAGGVYRYLYSGGIVHGIQNPSFLNRGEPLGYYHPSGPAGDVLGTLRQGEERVAVIGMGIGAMAAYARAGQAWDYYEIDPAVLKVAGNSELFSHLLWTKSPSNIVLGDGRLQIARAPDGWYDRIVVDAFSSDAIPVHLLTREAIELYFSKLKPGGVIAFHISNQHLHLEPVLAAYAESAGRAARVIWDERASQDRARKIYDSRWAILARDEKDLEAVTRFPGWRKAERPKGFRAWTDDFSNLLSVIRRS